MLMAEKELQQLIHSLKELQIKEQEIKRRQSEVIEQIEKLSRSYPSPRATRPSHTSRIFPKAHMIGGLEIEYTLPIESPSHWHSQRPTKETGTPPSGN